MKVVIRKLDKESREKPDWDYMIIGLESLPLGVDMDGKPLYAYQSFAVGNKESLIQTCKEEGWEYQIVEHPAHEKGH